MTRAAEWTSKEPFARHTDPPIGDYENQSERPWADVQHYTRKRWHFCGQDVSITLNVQFL